MRKERRAINRRSNNKHQNFSGEAQSVSLPPEMRADMPISAGIGKK